MPDHHPRKARSAAVAVDAMKAYLDPIVVRYERTSFIDKDPISIPHGFEKNQDREIIGLFAALLAWGRRDIMLRKMDELCERMQYRPYLFIREFSAESQAHRLDGFVHRTFNDSDAVWLCRSLSAVVHRYGSIDQLCSRFVDSGSPDARDAIQGLSDTLFSIVEGMPTRMRKHLPRPASGSACKRLNLYFRWMVRSGPVDLAIWKSIRPDQLLLPLDLHSGRQSRAVGLLKRNANDWKATLELTENCRLLCPEDPARYDFAFFGTGEAGETLTARDGP